MKKTKEKIIEYINSLKGYQGYVQFSDRRIKDIFETFSDIKVDAKDGFVYEAHFYNGKDSITIKQINNYWLVDETKDTPLADTQTYMAINNLKVKMAQIWKEVEDMLCELEKDDSDKTTKGMQVKKLKKVVFAGFENG